MTTPQREMVEQPPTKGSFSTISLKIIRKEWKVLSSVKVPVQPLKSSNITHARKSTSRTQKHFETDTDSDEEIERINSYGNLLAILDKRITPTGKVLYKVVWEGNRQTEEPPNNLQKFYTRIEAFEHKKLRSTSSKNAIGFMDDDELGDARGGYRLRRRNNTQDKDWKEREKVSSEESNDEYSAPIILRKRIRKNAMTNDSDSNAREESDDHNGMNSLSTDTSTNDTEDSEMESDTAASRRDKRRMSKASINHWSHCIKCQEKGTNIKTEMSKRGVVKYTPDQTLPRHPPKRLLLCTSCSAVSHRGCLPESSSSLKRYLGIYQVKDQTIMKFQCTRCISGRTKSFENLPSCDMCGKNHSSVYEENDMDDAENDETMAVSDQQNAFTTTYLSESSKEYDKPTNATEIAISETSTLFHIDVVRKNILPLFRCFRCYRTCHIECLPEFIDKETRFPDMTKEEQVKMGRNMCLKTWKCPECIMYKKEVERILTMRSTATSTTIDTSMEKHTSSEYQTQTFECLIKWKNTSYRHLTWVSEKWIKGLAPAAYKSLLDHYRNEEYSGEEDVVVKDWMAVDRILDMNTESDQTLILAKYCGLPYDQACWDTPPPSDSDLYPFYKDALRRYSIRKAMVPPTKMQERVRQVKAVATKESYSKHELKKQPNIIKGGELMKHQLDGLNWLLYQWERNQPCILADDMGLGKTIQIIVFFYYLFKKFNIYPFFIVVPNSTLENWLREFSKWAPDMLAVPYQGSAKSRELTRKYEIFSQDYPHPKIKCHVVVLTYESALYDMSYFLKSAYWPAMVVDEAHRLKNNSSLLFQKLQSLNTDHKILLTGTPLQNNIRELINIMHFVDPIRFKDLKTLGEKYKELSHELVQELHDHLKPYFLRRTKKLALKDLPPKFEIIVPLSMTNLQKEVYKSILSNNIVSFASTSSQSAPKLQKKARSVLMELRKTLNHPYLIQDVEVDQPSAEATQRALIDACEKLKVLHQMIPKLQKDGHRLLIFSTLRLTLDVLEDYLKAQSYKFVRLDGSCSQLERVKAIDAFNAPNSDIPVFLLTTRAGGVGINLATADTVLVWDSDFNPHADLQAISRAYRIGQKNPVLVLKFMTRLSIEEKIVQLSKKKMVIDHLVVDKMDDTELEVDDIESILKFGAQTLFEGDDSKDISYDSAAIDKLLDRSRIVHDTSDTIEEDTNATGESKDKTMSFSFAKVWSATDGETELVGLQNDKPEDSDFWNRFLREKREEQDSLKLKNEELGRGARKRTRVHYFDPSEQKNAQRKKQVDREPSDNEDAEFVVGLSEHEDEDEFFSPAAEIIGETLDAGLSYVNQLDESVAHNYQTYTNTLPSLTAKGKKRASHSSEGKTSNTGHHGPDRFITTLHTHPTLPTLKSAVGSTKLTKHNSPHLHGHSNNTAEEYSPTVNVSTRYDSTENNTPAYSSNGKLTVGYDSNGNATSFSAHQSQVEPFYQSATSASIIPQYLSLPHEIRGHIERERIIYQREVYNLERSLSNMGAPSAAVYRQALIQMNNYHINRLNHIIQEWSATNIPSGYHANTNNTNTRQDFGRVYYQPEQQRGYGNTIQSTSTAPQPQSPQQNTHNFPPIQQTSPQQVSHQQPQPQAHHQHVFGHLPPPPTSAFTNAFGNVLNPTSVSTKNRYFSTTTTSSGTGDTDVRLRDAAISRNTIRKVYTSNTNTTTSFGNAGLNEPIDLTKSPPTQQIASKQKPLSKQNPAHQQAAYDTMASDINSTHMAPASGPAHMPGTSASHPIQIINEAPPPRSLVWADQLSSTHSTNKAHTFKTIQPYKPIKSKLTAPLDTQEVEIIRKPTEENTLAPLQTLAVNNHSTGKVSLHSTDATGSLFFHAASSNTEPTPRPAEASAVHDTSAAQQHYSTKPAPVKTTTHPSAEANTADRLKVYNCLLCSQEHIRSDKCNNLYSIEHIKAAYQKLDAWRMAEESRHGLRKELDLLYQRAVEYRTLLELNQGKVKQDD